MQVITAAWPIDIERLAHSEQPGLPLHGHRAVAHACRIDAAATHLTQVGIADTGNLEREECQTGAERAHHLIIVGRAQIFRVYADRLQHRIDRAQADELPERLETVVED